MTTQTVPARIPRADVKSNGRAEHIWPLPPEEAFLDRLLRDLFENHHEKLTFGPLIQGAAFELKAPGKPQSITLSDGYLTVHWGGRGHFHLCIGSNYGALKSEGGPELMVRRRTSRAEFYRSLDTHGHPVSWGLRLFNGAGEPQISIFLPNPFLTDDDQVSDEADFSRLVLWDSLMRRYAGQDPDPLDRQGKGFRHG
ncbi:MAG: hypothetical protein ACK4Y9_08625 [Hyphomonas sp.]